LKDNVLELISFGAFGENKITVAADQIVGSLAFNERHFILSPKYRSIRFIWIFDQDYPQRNLAIGLFHSSKLQILD